MARLISDMPRVYVSAVDKRQGTHWHGTVYDATPDEIAEALIAHFSLVSGRQPNVAEPADVSTGAGARDGARSNHSTNTGRKRPKAARKRA